MEASSIGAETLNPQVDHKKTEIDLDLIERDEFVNRLQEREEKK